MYYNFKKNLFVMDIEVTSVKKVDKLLNTECIILHQIQ